MNDHQIDFFNKITESASRLTATENTIAEHLMSTYPNCMLKTSYELASEIDVNVSTVTRFFQKIGYKSIKTAQSDFKKAIDLQASTAQRRLDEEYEDDTRTSVIGAHAVNETANIEQTFNSISMDDLEILVGILSSRKNQVIIAGNTGTPGPVASYMFNRLQRTRPNVTLLSNDQSHIAAALATIDTNDILLIFDYKKYSKLSLQAAKSVKARNGRVVLFTDSPLAPIIKTADISFETRTFSPGHLPSHIAAMALINLIIDMLSDNWEDYIKERATKLDQAYKDLNL